MTPAFMAHINGIVTSKNSVAVTERVKAMVAAGVEMKYRGFAEAPKAKARTFQENLVLINPLLRFSPGSCLGSTRNVFPHAM